MIHASDFAGLGEKLYSAVLSDVMDGFGYRKQALNSSIRPLDDTLTLCGRARTGTYMAIYDADDPDENPYEVEIRLIDDVAPGEVPVLACAGNLAIAPWGELLTTATVMRGGVGCVTDGLCRDVRAIRQRRFPVFAGGIGPLDSRGRGKMLAMDRPVECGGAMVRSGDIIFGDVDGVVVIPQAIEEQVIEAALEKITGENMTREELLGGSKLAEVYAKYGVL